MGEMGLYNGFKIPNFVNFYRYEDFYELECPQKLVHMVRMFQDSADSLVTWHQNYTGTAGLFYLINDKNDPAVAMSWMWVSQHFNHRVSAMLSRMVAWIQIFSLALNSHDPGCLYVMPSIRKLFVEFLTHLKRLQSDHVALMWNGAAFGMLGDVTRDDFEEWELTDEEKEEFGVANKSKEQIQKDRQKVQSRFSQNMIFQNMYIGSASQFLQFYAQQVTNEAQELLVRWDRERAEVGAENSVVTVGAKAHDRVKSHHQDEFGMFMPYELWRREVFKQWAVDKGLTRGILKYVIDDLYADRSFADFGAGGGHYAKWFNETGLIRAWAYDGIEGVEKVTKGAVSHWNLVEDDGSHWTNYDYGMCLEVLEHIPRNFTGRVLKAISRYVKKRLVMSWSADREGIGHVHCRSEEEYRPLVEAFGWRVNHEATLRLKEMATVEYIRQSVTVFDKIEGFDLESVDPEKLDLGKDQKTLWEERQLEKQRAAAADAAAALE